MEAQETIIFVYRSIEAVKMQKIKFTRLWCIVHTYNSWLSTKIPKGSLLGVLLSEKPPSFLSFAI